MAHEVCYTFEHTPGLKDKRGEGNLAGISPDSRGNGQDSNGSAVNATLRRRLCGETTRSGTSLMHLFFGSNIGRVSGKIPQLRDYG